MLKLLEFYGKTNDEVFFQVPYWASTAKGKATLKFRISAHFLKFISPPPPQFLSEANPFCCWLIAVAVFLQLNKSFYRKLKGLRPIYLTPPHVASFYMILHHEIARGKGRCTTRGLHWSHLYNHFPCFIFLNFPILLKFKKSL